MTSSGARGGRRAGTGRGGGRAGAGGQAVRYARCGQVGGFKCRRLRCQRKLGLFCCRPPEFASHLVRLLPLSPSLEANDCPGSDASLQRPLVEDR